MRGSSRRARPGLRATSLSQVLAGGWRQPGTPNATRPKPRNGRNARLILHTRKRRRQITRRQTKAAPGASGSVLRNAKLIADFAASCATIPKPAQPINHAGDAPDAIIHGLRPQGRAFRLRASAKSPTQMIPSPTA